MMKSALSGTKVRHYQGIDLSQPALDLAAANLAGAPLEVDLDHRDFVEAMMRRPEHADAAWCSLSIHHLATDDKLRLMKAIRGATGPRGLFFAVRTDASGGRGPRGVSRSLPADQQAAVERVDPGRMGPDLAACHYVRLPRDGGRLV